MQHDMSIKYGDIEVRPLSAEDCEPLRTLRNRNRQYFFSSAEISREQQENWFRNYLAKENDYVFSVFYNNVWVGSASLYNISGAGGEFGRIVVDGDRVSRKGLGSEAVRAVCKIGFEKLGLESIFLEVLSDNKRAIHAYEKAGFQFTEETASGGTNITKMQLNKGD